MCQGSKVTLYQVSILPIGKIVVILTDQVIIDSLHIEYKVCRLSLRV